MYNRYSTTDIHITAENIIPCETFVADNSGYIAVYNASV